MRTHAAADGNGAHGAPYFFPVLRQSDHPHFAGLLNIFALRRPEQRFGTLTSCCP